MADNKYVYRNAITAYATRMQFSKVSGVLYLVANMETNGVSWVTMNYSVDDGETWVDELLPVDASSVLDPKLVVIGDCWYVFAHGANSAGVDVVKFCRRLASGTTAVWDKTWTTLFPSATTASRVTSAVLDQSGTFIHLAFDELLATGKYEVRYAKFALADDSLALNVGVSSTPSTSQHNANLALVNTNTIGVVYEQENVNKVLEVHYTQYNFIDDEWAEIITLSNDAYNNNFHPSITVDGLGVAHVAWLLSLDSFKTSRVVYTKVVDLAKLTPEVVSTEAAKNNYPRVVVANEDVYIVFNTDSTVSYLVRHQGESAWTSVTNLTDDTWVVLDAVYADGNLYTVCVNKLQVVTLVRVDVNLAETFAPIHDLRVVSVTNAVMNLAWTKARNAVAVHVDRLNTQSWDVATTLPSVGPADASAHVVNLDAGVYRFRVLSTLADGTQQLTTVGDAVVNTVAKGDLVVAWTPLANVTAQVLEFTLETWSTILEVSPTSDTCAVALASELTRYRLVVVGGVAEGLSNIVSPLKVTITADDDVELDWSGLSDVDSIVVEQSIDLQHWHPVVTTTALTSADTSCVIPRVADVVYSYRLTYVTTSGSTLTTNVVSIVNSFQATAVSFDNVTVNWVDVTAGEHHRVQFSSSDGAGWVNATNAVNGQSMTVTGLDHATRYLMRLYFPNRVTGVYSNVIDLTTKPRPITDLTLVSSTSTTAELTFTTTDVFTSGHIELLDAVTKASSDIDLTTVDVVNVVNDVTTHTVTLGKLPLGSYLDVTVVLDNGRQAGQSNVVNVTTTGNGPTNVKVTPGDHSLTVSCDPLERITAANVAEYVAILVTSDGVAWTTVPVTKLDGNFAFTVTDLLQATTYAVRLVVVYGDNYGMSDVMQAVVNPSAYAPIHGRRLVGERTCAVRADGSILTYDRGVLYSTTPAGVSSILVDLHVDSQYSFAKLVVDQADVAHLVFTHAKRLLYCTDAVVDGVKQSLGAPRELAADETVNAYTAVDAVVGYDNVVTVVWEEDHGYFSNVAMARLLNGVTVDAPSLLIADGTSNHLPRVAAKRAGGYHVACLGSASVKVADATLVVDPAADNFLKESITVNVYDVGDSAGTWLAITEDNLDGLHLVYNSTSSDLPATSYVTLTGGKFVVDRVMPLISDATLVLNVDQVVLGRSGSAALATRYVAADATWTDVSTVGSLGVVDDNTLTTVFVNDEFVLVDVHAGELVVKRLPRATIVAKQNVVNGRWIAGKLSLTMNRGTVDVWTCGDVDASPLLFMKVNTVYHDITPRDEFGAVKYASLTTKSLVTVDIADASVADLKAAGAVDVVRLTITANSVDVDLLVDCTAMLAYSWDRSTIINKTTSS